MAISRSSTPRPSSRSGGTVVATNTSGQVTIAYWAKGAFAPGSGALVLFSDVDMISNCVRKIPYSPTLNANGILALNTMAWLTQGASGDSRALDLRPDGARRFGVAGSPPEDDAFCALNLT